MKPISYNFYGFVTTVAQEWQGSHVGLSVGPCLQVHSFRKCKLNEADLTAISSGWNSQLDIFHWKRLFIIVCGLKTQTCCLFHWVLASGRKDLTSLPLIPPQLQPNCMKTFITDLCLKVLRDFCKGANFRRGSSWDRTLWNPGPWKLAHLCRMCAQLVSCAQYTYETRRALGKVFWEEGWGSGGGDK